MCHAEGCLNQSHFLYFSPPFNKSQHTKCQGRALEEREHNIEILKAFKQKERDADVAEECLMCTTESNAGPQVCKRGGEKPKTIREV